MVNFREAYISTLREILKKDVGVYLRIRCDASTKDHESKQQQTNEWNAFEFRAGASRSVTFVLDPYLDPLIYMSMNLPTPPRTTHKDKENQPPTPLTPSNSSSRTPRIVWSQENLHHAYTTQIRQLPSPTHFRGPLKSILKKPSLPLTPLMPPEPSAREVTPEPADPLHHPLYLNSPITTLVASLRPGMDARITLTDLTEAYSVLSARLKTKAKSMLDMCGTFPALEPLREHNVELVKAFHRDIGRAFVDPQSSPLPSNDSPWSTPSSVGSVKKRGFTDEEVKHARDLCNLSHAAMRCFSNISVIPVLISVFTGACRATH